MTEEYMTRQDNTYQTSLVDASLTPALHHQEGEGTPPWVARGIAKFACVNKINSRITVNELTVCIA